MSEDPEITEGGVAPAVVDEHPDLGLCWVTAPGTPTRSARSVRARLGALSGRHSGAQAVTMRTRPIVHAYRVFYRHIGLDPDAHGARTPAEEAGMRRLIEGAYVARDRVADAVLLAIVETGVAVWALDAATLAGPLTVREAVRGETLGVGPYANELPGGRLVVADGRGVVAVLFGEIADERRPTKTTCAVTLFALTVEGVPRLHVEEALWTAADALAAR